MGRVPNASRSGAGSFVTFVMVVAAVTLGGLLLSNQDEVKGRAAEVERVQRDLVGLSEEIQLLAEQEQTRGSTLFEQERLARDRFRWTAPGEYILQIHEP